MLTDRKLAKTKKKSMSKRRSKVKKTGRNRQRRTPLSNHKLLSKIYDQNQQKLRRLQNARFINYIKDTSAKPLDALRRYQNLRAQIFSPPAPRIKRLLRKDIGRRKLFHTRPLKDYICKARKIRKIMMFAKGHIGHGTTGQRRKMSWFSKVRC